MHRVERSGIVGQVGFDMPLLLSRDVSSTDLPICEMILNIELRVKLVGSRSLSRLIGSGSSNIHVKQ